MRRLVRSTALAIVLVFIVLFASINFRLAVAQPDNNFTITGAPSSVTAGQSFSGVTVTVYNSAGQQWTSYTGQVYFTSTDPKATLPYTAASPYTFTTGADGDNGEHTFSGFNLETAGSQTITVTIASGSMSATTGTITVNPSTPVQIQISPMTATIEAGAKQTYKATAIDGFGNSWDVSSLTYWFIGSTGAGGSWSGSTYTSAVAGTWTVWGLYDDLLGYASLTVTPSSAISITISPKTPTATAGGSVTFTASAQDSYGNSWDVTSSTTWSIDSGAGGSWSGNVYTSAKAGVWEVTGTYEGYSNTASLTVNRANAVNITISPTNPTFPAGTPVTFTATASDYYGNTWDVTNSVSWSISLGAGGSWSGNVYTSAKVGIWTVTASYPGLNSATTTLTVSYANVYSIAISPINPTLQAGQSQQFTATASDIYGNVWDVSDLTAWAISPGAGGSWTGSTYTAAMAGTWTVTGTYEGLSGTATLTVTPGPAVSMVVGSTVSSTTAGSSVTYTATLFDNYGNSWDVSNLVYWSIDSGAGGSWSGNVYTAAKAGNWIVTGEYSYSLHDTASLTVTPGQPISLVITPSTADLTAGLTQTYTATATDGFSNSWDVSQLTTWTISSGAGGSWFNNVYSAAIAGTWTVTGTYLGLSDTSSLSVTHTYAVRIQINPETASIVAGTPQTFTTTAFDHFGNSWDSTSSSTFTVPEEAGGSLNGNVYTSAIAGTWNIIDTSLGLTDTCALTVTHAAIIGLVVSPNSASITAGTAQAYTATASDTYGNIWDVSSLATWTVSSGAGGSWTGNVYSSVTAGNWVVEGTYSGLSDRAYLAVNPASAQSLSISPATATITTGSNEAYTATATDKYGNTWDVTDSTVWVIDSGAGGSWSANVYSSVNAGTWKVTGIYDSLTATASLTVNHGAAVSLVISPSTATLTAGWPQAFTAEAQDANGNPFAVTSSTSWTIDPEAEGSWSGSTYYSNTAGTWTVTGTYLGLTSTAQITVTHAQAASITVGLSPSTLIAGQTATFTATASDLYGNTWDVTSQTVWSINPGAGGSLIGNSFTSELSGTWAVTGTYNSLSQSVYLTVTHASAVGISVNPSDAIVTAGSNEVYSVSAFDTFDNTWDVTSAATLSVNSGAEGSWSGNTYTPAIAGTWTITATYDSFSVKTSITIVHGNATSITISPKRQTINAGTSETFTATAYDAYGNSWDISTSVLWIIDSGAQGSWSNNVYTSAKAGTWQVTGVYYNLLEDQTFLTVEHGTLTSLTIAPATATIYQGATQTYTSTASDAFGNTWTATSTTTWQISPGASGSWAGNTYTSANPGTWTVTGTSGTVPGTAQLTVNAYSPVDFAHTGQVNFLDITYFVYWYVYYGEYGYCNPVCDFNHDGKLNFQDVVLFAVYYIAATTPTDNN